MTQKNSWAQYLGIAGQIGFIIAIPVVAFTLLGRYLDNFYGTSPWFFLGGIIGAFLVSSAILYAQVWKALKFFAEEEKENQGETATKKLDVETLEKKESTSILDTQKQYAEESKREIFEDSEFEDDEE